MKKYELYEKLQNNTLANKIWCIHSNKINKDIKASYQKGSFIFEVNGLSLKFYDNFFYEWHCVKGYLRHYKPKEGDIIFDIGAGFGAYTIYASKLIGDKGKIYSFEPDSKNAEKLRKNLELNDIKNVEIISKVVIDKPKGKIRFMELGNDISRILIGEENESVKSIETTSIDEEVKELKLDKLDFIKMDIEGAEIDALLGAKESMKKFNINFAIASYHYQNSVQTFLEVERIFKEVGYKYKTEYPVHLTTYAKND